MALLLQSLSARLGIVRGRDLAQANRELYPKYINFALYVLAEIAIAATDLAEVLGMAIGIHLLTGMPLLFGVLITIPRVRSLNAAASSPSSNVQSGACRVTIRGTAPEMIVSGP